VRNCYDLDPFTEEKSISYPIFVPAKKRVRFAIHLTPYGYPGKEKENPDLAERRRYRHAIEKYLAEELTNLDGFDLLDESNRYEINFPSGWKTPQQER
jgi:hypothetical protein